MVELKSSKAGEIPVSRFRFENPKPKQYRFVTIYTGFRSAADAKIRNLNFQACTCDVEIYGIGRVGGCDAF